MTYYNVIQPCVIAGKHYVRPTVQPIEVDDDVAAPLLADGAVTRYLTSEAPVEKFEPGTFLGVADPGEREDDEPPTDPPPARKSRGKRTGD